MDSNDLAHLEALGYEGVLAQMAKGEGRLGRPGSQIREDVSHWLKLKEAERDAEASAKRDAREEETLSIAKRALATAENANTIATSDLAAAREQARWAKWAAILAAVAAIIATKDQILLLIFNAN